MQSPARPLVKRALAIWVAQQSRQVNHNGASAPR